MGLTYTLYAHYKQRPVLTEVRSGLTSNTQTSELFTGLHHYGYLFYIPKPALGHVQHTQDYVSIIWFHLTIIRNQDNQAYEAKSLSQPNVSPACLHERAWQHLTNHKYGLVNWQ